jgi:hypothetical protein
MRAINLHQRILRSSPSLRRNPGNDSIGVADITGLAVHTIGKIDSELLFPGRLIFDHLIDPGGTEFYARVLKLLTAAAVTDGEVLHMKMAGLVLIMEGSGMKDILGLVKGQLTVKLRRFLGIVFPGILLYLFHILKVFLGVSPRGQPLPSGKEPESGIQHTGNGAPIKPLMKIPRCPEITFHITCLDLLLIGPENLS